MGQDEPEEHDAGEERRVADELERAVERLVRDARVPERDGEQRGEPTAEGSAHRLRADPATTAAYPVGTYGWHCRVTDGTDAFTVESGSTEVLPDLASATTLDTRSHAQKTLAALESWIEGHDLAVAEYEIANRRMKHIPITDLLKLRDQYRREVRGASGKSGRVYVRF